ncbi:zinc finger and SCAN domain containing protein 4D-like isoform X1 [Episyrphus balteatus]|uniref:zinc finger and SCAN domain containing protein 4D-like isoform X1 n=1 Tax=Episyrphus balteatus TaxID=286459 RepID=UPI002485453E|nr:zinc finger and SCAN domain containing protein 4D-like isoform X1 [Episyrphus balteatus]
MEVAHINNAIQNGNLVHQKSAVYNVDIVREKSIIFNIELTQIRKTAESFKLEVGDVTNIHVTSVGRRMRMYENQLWTKVVEDERTKFKCLLCNKVLCHFWSLRNHMFLHLEIYPFKCFACDKKYPSNMSLKCHKKIKHYNLMMSLSAGHWLKN